MAPPLRAPSYPSGDLRGPARAATFPGRRTVDEEPVRRGVRAVATGPPGVLGGGGRGSLLGAALGPRVRRRAATLLSLVHRGRAEHLLQRARPARRPRPRQAA